MRTQYPTYVDNCTNLSLRDAFSLKIWGGTTFDIAMRLLYKCHWERLKTLRNKVPQVSFQMMLCGINAMGYTNYPDNLVQKFCKQASKYSVEILRIFDSINNTEKLKLGVDAIVSTSGFMEGNLYYTGGVLDTNKGKCDIEYYINVTSDLASMGVHYLSVKDMVGLLTTRAATMLV